MQRLCTKLRSLASLSSHHRLIHSYPHLCHHPPLHVAAASSKWNYNVSLLNASSSLPIQLPSAAGLPSLRLSPLSHSLVQVRHISSRERKKRRKPMTPRTSKVKKVKIKCYSSYKDRFRTLNDGTIRRWREGKNHNAHSKSRKARRRLRQPSIVPAAYAKVMKKLNFSA